MAEVAQPPAQQPRAYQLEMLQASLKENIIVAVSDPFQFLGSGKTNIAVLRINEAFKQPESIGKLAWFLCPNVALAQQQHAVMENQLPGLSARLIVGEDGVDHWSTQDLWDAVFLNVQVIVSTYQVLYDALQHAFLTMENLCLLIVDEAHNCHGNTPVNRIMLTFYHPAKARKIKVPSILGLTASPVVKSSTTEMKIIEASLDAVCRSPTASREELLKHTQQPMMKLMPFESIAAEADADLLLASFWGQYNALDMSRDPEVIQLLRDGHTPYSDKYYKAFKLRRTWICKQLRSFHSNAKELHHQLGMWANRRYLTSLHIEIRRQMGSHALETMRSEQLICLAGVFERSGIPLKKERLPPVTSEVSPKAHRLLDILLSEVGKESAGIVFANMRSTVSLLRILISTSESTKNQVRVGSFVGLANNSQKASDIGNLVNKTGHSKTVNGLRTRENNLIVSTSACEEGIDISACNFVICFEEPQNLKSYIQRRGRARAKDSKYLIMHTDDQKVLKKDWETLEEEMKKAYNDDRRQLEELAQQESSSDEYKELVEPSTGAIITLDNAVAHLDHFCNKLPFAEFASCHPEYIFSTISGLHGCTVELPNAMPASLRKFRASRPWSTQQIAKKDAALEAYTALYKAGFLNEHLLPEPVIDSELKATLLNVEKREGLEKVSEQLDPMDTLNISWLTTEIIYLYRIRIVDTQGQGENVFNALSDIMIGLPFTLDDTGPLNVYWDHETTWSFELQFHSEVSCNDHLEVFNRATHALMWSAFRTQMDSFQSRADKEKTSISQDKYPVLFFPEHEMTDLANWTLKVNTPTDGQEFSKRNDIAEQSSKFILRLKNAGGRGFIYQGIEYREIIKRRQTEDKTNEVVLCFEGRRLPRRTDFLRPVPALQKPMTTSLWLPCDATEITCMSVGEANCALLIPSFIHYIGKVVLARSFRSNIISLLPQAQCPQALTRTKLIQEATTSPSAREPVNYQRLEFLGDAVLGLCTSAQTAADHPMWHEGYLTQLKSHIVSNARLAKASCKTGLPQYILTKAFTGLKWRPPTLRKSHVSEESKPDAAARQLSTKVLADVVEALIGASFQEAYERDLVTSLSGIHSGLVSMMKLFIPEINWLEHEENVKRLREGALSSGNQLPAHFIPLEDLIGHHFSRPVLLVEALTHPSYTGASQASSYNRLEFLGDSVLQFLVTRFIFNQGEKELSVPRMHLLRTAAVNNQLLAFLAMNLKLVVTQKDVVLKEQGGDDDDQRVGASPVSTTAIHSTRRVPPTYVTLSQTKEKALHDFMFHGPFSSLAEARIESLERFEKYRAEIEKSLFAGPEYPWTLMARFGPEKYFGDIVESVLGAIYVDSGSAQACSDFLDKLGLWNFLQHAITHEMQVRQPKEELGIVAGQETVSYETHRHESRAPAVPSDNGSDIGDIDDIFPSIIEASETVLTDFVESNAIQGGGDGEDSDSEMKDPNRSSDVDENEDNDDFAASIPIGTFFSSVFVGLKGLGRGTGRSKLEAETFAAAEALRRIRDEGGGSLAAVQPIPALGLKRKRELAGEEKKDIEAGAGDEKGDGFHQKTADGDSLETGENDEELDNFADMDIE